jgi:hypothetical protein
MVEAQITGAGGSAFSFRFLAPALHVNFTKKKKNARLLFVNLTFFGLFPSPVKLFSDLVVDVAAIIAYIVARTFFTSAVAMFISVVHLYT